MFYNFYMEFEFYETSNILCVISLDVTGYFMNGGKGRRNNDIQA